jgi:hypothetical protein
MLQPASGPVLEDIDKKRQFEDTPEYDGKNERRKLEDKKGEKREVEKNVNDEPPAKVLVAGLEVNQDTELEWETWAKEEIIDQKSGKILDPELVVAARAEEVDFMRKIKLYEKAPVTEAWEMTGKAPTSVKWVDLDKGNDEEPDVRCRLVGRDFKPKGEKDREDLFAAMPPLECKEILFRKAVQMPRRGGKKMKLLFIDVKKAHLNVFLEEGEHAYIELPEEDAEIGMCGRLRRWLYGMRPAASAWEKDYTVNLESIGFQRGLAAPTVFFNPATSTRCVVHWDIFTFLGYEDDLLDITKAFQDWSEIKVRGILGGGGVCGELEEITILNRKLRWVGNAIEYEADDKHARILCSELGLADESNGLEAPIVKETLADLQDDDEELDEIEATRFRGLAARGELPSARPNRHTVRHKGELQRNGKTEKWELGEIEKAWTVLA